MSTTTSTTQDEKLDALGAALGGRKRVLIVPHDFPDPDALATAAALHLLLKQRFGVNGQIAFSGGVSRAENKELLRRIRYRWHRAADLRAPARGKIPAIFVDTAPWSRNVTTPRFAQPVAVIDHHQHPTRRGGRRRQSLFTDIRAGAGATTTIAHEYLKRAGIQPPRWLAAIMAYAIASETLDLSRDSDKSDLDAYIELAAQADLKIIGRIRHAPLPRDYFTHLGQAIRSTRQIGTVAFSHLQNIEQPEIVAEIADLLLRMEGVRWSFCTANFNDGAYVSLRSRQPGAHCARLLRSAMGRDGSAGGHNQLAAGYLKLEGKTWAARAQRRQIFVRTLLRKILKNLPENPNQLDALCKPLTASSPLGGEKTSRKRRAS